MTMLMTGPLLQVWPDQPTNHDCGRRPRTGSRRAGSENDSVRITVGNFRSAGIGSSPKALATNHDRIFTTTSQDADMACDGPGVRHELTLAGTGRLPDKNSKGMRNRGIHKHT